MDIHLKRLRARFEISAEEEAFIRALPDRTETYRADQTAVRTGQPLTHSTVLLEGVMARHRDLSSGTRQVTEIHVPGDFTDLHGFTLKRLDHDVVALSACKVALIPHERLWRMMKEQPRLTRIYWFGTNLDAAVHREWVVSMGRRQGMARMAHLFCEMYIRSSVAGLVDQNSCDMPLTQEMLADALGLTGVHVNRTLQQLRETGMVDHKNGRLFVHDLRKLASFADFDPSYLHLRNGHAAALT